MVDMEIKQMNTMDVANTIVEQLGGNKFRTMTGARDFVGSKSGVSFRLPGGGGFTKKGINRVHVVLMPSDTYVVTFERAYTVKGFPMTKTISVHSDVYFDALQEIFTRETGLEVSL